MEDASRFDQCGVGIRGVAMAIDSAVWIAALFGAVFAVGLATGQIETTSTGASTELEGTAGLTAFALWFALAIGYHAVLEWRFGRTLGKYLVSIRVVSDDGTTPSLGASVARNVARLVDWLPMFYTVGIAAILASDRSRRLGDRIGGTDVVRR